MKLLLTSLGLVNDSIKAALTAMTGKPIDQCKAVFIPTAAHAMEGGSSYLPIILKEQLDTGWQSLDIVELTALPSMLEAHWLPALAAADVIMVAGGNTPYLSYWLQQSGLADKLPALLQDKVYVGVSAGSMTAAHQFNVNSETLKQTGVYDDDIYHDVAPLHFGSDQTLRLTDFVLLPHLNSEYFPDLTMERLEQAAKPFDVPVYIIDDQSAVQYVDGHAEVVSEGTWKLIG